MNHYLSLIDPISFKFVDNVTIENNFLETRFFEETVELRENLYILAYSINEDVIKLQFKNISVLEIEDGKILSYEDYFKKISEIFINEDKSFVFKSGSFK